jgi:hypothetical protein
MVLLIDRIVLEKAAQRCHAGAYGAPLLIRLRDQIAA